MLLWCEWDWQCVEEERMNTLSLESLKYLYTTTTTTTSILMPLSRLVGVGNFCFDMLSPFHSIVHILSSQAILFQIFLYALFPRFPWSTLLSFPWYFMLHDLTYLGADISTNDMTIAPQMSLTYGIFNHQTTLSQRTSVDTLSTSLTPHIILIIRYSTPRILISSASVSSHVSQQYNKTGLTQH